VVKLLASFERLGFADQDRRPRPPAAQRDSPLDGGLEPRVPQPAVRHERFQRLVVPAVAAAHVEDVTREPMQELANAVVVAAEDVDAHGLEHARAGPLLRAPRAEVAPAELDQVLREIIGRVLRRDVEVDLSDVVLRRLDLQVGEIARLRAITLDARTVAQEQVASAIPRRNAPLADGASPVADLPRVGFVHVVKGIRARPAGRRMDLVVPVHLAVTPV